MVINLQLVDEELVTLTGVNLRDGPGKVYKALKVLPVGTILWPQQKIPSWVQGKLVTQEGKPASDWIKIGVLTPIGAEERTGQVIGYCWIGSAENPTVASVKKDVTADT